MKHTSLPTEFAELSGKVDFVQMNNQNHYRSSCPECKDFNHSSKSGPPDRFQMWIRSQATGAPFGWCNRCNYKWWPGKETGQEIDPETLRKLKAQSDARQQAQDNRRREKLAEFTDQEIWKEYCERMESKNQDWWINQGIPLEIQQYLSLGYRKNKKYMYQGELHESPAYTIPWFGENFDFLTMQYRLTNSIDPSDKYRFEYELEGGKTHFFRADPSEKIGDKVIVCEGAKKAMVTRYQLLSIDTKFVVIAAAAKSTIDPIIEAVKESGLVYVIFDPDGIGQSKKLCREIGKNAHPVRLPYKVDDGFLQYGLRQNDFMRILDTVL